MDKFYKGVGKTFAFLVMGLLMAFPATWFLMIGLGILHAHWHHIPAFGYWETYVLYVALNMAGQAIKTGIKPSAEAVARPWVTSKAGLADKKEATVVR